MSKYGIHITSRLRPEDEAGGQSNWADIDEDDDNWEAPEIITWTDGTKSSLQAVEAASAAAAPAPPKDLPRAEKPVSPAPAPAPMATGPPPPASTAPSAPSAPSPSVTAAPSASSTPVPAKASPSIKPGVLGSGKGLVLKGASEKPTLVAKPTPKSSEIKSPWATLPPVEKTSPLAMDAGLQHPSNVRGYPPTRDNHGAHGAHGAHGMPPPPMAKEIAADDFSRNAWREGPAGGNRELFNSQSGRYEPVHDRRASRPDISRQHTSLLQRQSHHDTQGPAEPSAAFQTHRNSGHDAPPYGRRRTSSNVSGGSGSLAGRPGKHGDMPPPADAMVHPPGAPSGPGPGPGPGPFAAPSMPPHARPQGGPPTWQPRPSPGQSFATPEHAPPAPEAAPTLPGESEVEMQKRLMRERRELAIKRRVEEEEREEAARRERIRLKLEAMGPPPERKSAKKEQAAEGPAATQARDTTKPEPSSTEKPPAEVATPPTDKADASEGGTKPQLNGLQRSYHADRSHNTAGLPATNQTTASWPDAQPPAERLPSWSGASPQSARNVWGAPGNDRTLGNGTFHTDLGHLADSQPTQPASISNRPAPIGPPRTSGQPSQGRNEAASGKLPPIGPPSNRASQSQAMTGRPLARNLWGTAAIEESDRALRTQNRERLDEQMRDLASRGMTLDDAQAPVKDTWRPVSLDDDGKRVTGSAVTKVHGERWNAAAPQTDRPPSSRQQEHASQDYRTQPGSARNDMRQPSIGGGPGAQAQGRPGSRFFPHSSRDVRLEESHTHARSKSPTPPPPTMDGHPAYDGDAAHPQVALPPMKPVVRLPPASPASAHQAVAPVAAPAPIGPPKPAAPISFAAAAAAPPRAHPQIQFGTQESWQDKINNLMGRKRVSASGPTVVDSASKSAFDAHGQNAATVSLPSQSLGPSSHGPVSPVTSKVMAEDYLHEQEMGSLPPIHLPTKVPEAMRNPAEVNWHPSLARYRVDPTGAEEPRISPEYINNKPMMRIQMPGMDEAKLLPLPMGSRNRSNPRRQGLRGSRHSSRGGPRGGRDEAGGSLGSDRPERSERSSASRGRGGFRARSDNWTRHSTAPQTAQS